MGGMTGQFGHGQTLYGRKPHRQFGFVQPPRPERPMVDPRCTEDTALALFRAYSVLGAPLPIKPKRPMTYTSSLLRLLDERGYIHQMTDAGGLDALAAKQTVPGYVGFDATAPSLHVGNLVSIMLPRRLQQAGHKPVVLMGGGTTRIGDPTGKDEVRKMLTDEAIQANNA